MKAKKLLSMLVSLAMTATVMAVPVMAETPVADMGELAQAIQNAQEGDTIVLEAKEYDVTAREQLRIETDGLTIQGVEGTVIDLNGFDCSGQAGIFVLADNVTLKDFKLTDSTYTGTTTNYSAIKGTSMDGGQIENVRVENVTIDNVSSHGINMHHVKSAVISGCSITNFGKSGIAAANADVTVENTTIGAAKSFSWNSIMLTWEDGDPVDYPAPASVILTGSTVEGSIRAESDQGFIASDTGLYSLGLLGMYSTEPTDGVTYFEVTTAEGASVSFPDGVLDLAEVIERAPAGSTVTIPAGQYDISDVEIPSEGTPVGEFDYAEPLHLNKPITLVGEDGAELLGTISVESSDVTIENILFTAPDIITFDIEPVCIAINSGNYSDITIQDCEFKTEPFGKDRKKYKGIVTSGSGTYTNLTVDGCTFTNLETGIHLGQNVSGYGVSNVLIQNNVMNGIRSGWNKSAFLKIEGADGVEVTQNDVDTADVYVRPGADIASDVSITDNSFTGSLIQLDKGKPVEDAIELNANYWGNENPDLDSILTGSGAQDTEVLFENFYMNEESVGNEDQLVWFSDELAEVIKQIGLSQTAGTNQIEVYLQGRTAEGAAVVIENLVAADLTFTLSDGFSIAAIEPAEGWTYEDKGNGRILFHEEGFETGSWNKNLDLNGAQIKLGTLTLSGYGEGSIEAVGSDDEAIQQRSKDGENELAKSPATAAAESNPLSIAITREQAKLTVDLQFKNELAEGNEADYNDITITISGMDEADQVYRLGMGEDETPYSADGARIEAMVSKGGRYTVTVKGAGYRTFSQNVLMDEDKTMYVWNNAKDTAATVIDDIEKNTTFLAGDIVMDYEIDLYDLSAVVSYFGEDNFTEDHPEYARYDLNRDGRINATDVAMVLVSWGK